MTETILFDIWNLGNWNLFVIWSLGFGALLFSLCSMLSAPCGFVGSIESYPFERERIGDETQEEG